jgi:hypothetical protein
MRHTALLLLILLSLTLAAVAQPEDSGEPWLMVRAVTQDGAVYAGVPSVRLARVVGDLRVAVENRAAVAAPPAMLVLGLAPGPYELTVSLPALGIAAGPLPVTIEPGLNSYDWRLPPMARISGAFEGKAAPTHGAAFVRTSAGVLRPSEVTFTPDGQFHLNSGLPAGAYDVLLLTDVGWALEHVDVAADVESATVAVTLQPGCVIAGTVTDAQSAAGIATATVTLRGYLRSGPLVNAVPAYTVALDAQGAFTTPHLPPGTWRATASATGYFATKVNIAAKAGETAPAALKLTRP